jgi:tetratricopeptide (TPR) repeat protein
MNGGPVDRAGLLRQGIAAHREGRLQEAQRCYQGLLDLDPMHLETLRLAASAMMQAGDPAAALALLDRAVRVDARHAGVLNERGIALWRLGRLQEALASHAEALRLKPDDVEALNNRAVMLLELGRPEEALAGLEAAIRIRPDHASALSNRGNALFALGRLEEALAAYSEAIRVKPGYAKAFHNRAVALRDLKRYDEALADFEAVIRLRPGDADAIAKRGRLRLFLRRFPEAFADHRHRWTDPDHKSPRQPTTLPSCAPGALGGRLLLWAEQGIGDEVFFAGLLPELLKREVSVTLTADKRLHGLFARAFPQVRLLDRAVTIRTSIDDGHDAQAPIGDLGHLLGMDEASIAASRKVYLKPDGRRREEMRAKLAALGGGRRVCGIAWRSANRKFSEAKSIDLVKLRPLLGTPDTVFVNLQYGAVDAELEALHAQTGLRVHRIEGLDVREDIDGLTALIDACDTVVTASNVTAHLAGAIGKRTAVLVPNSKGRLWYWHEGEERSLWYPSLRLFCQDDPVDWTRQIEACARWFRDPASTPD